MGFAREHDAFELGVGQESVRDHALRQHRPVCRHGMRHRGHGGGLHQRRRMGDRARHPHRARPPGIVGAGVGRVGRFIWFVRNGVRNAGLDGELGDGSPVMDGCECGGGIGAGAAIRDRRGDRLAEQVAGRAGRDRPDEVRADRESRRHTRDDGVEQCTGVGGARLPVDVDTGRGRALDHGEPRVKAGAPPGIGAAVDGSCTKASTDCFATSRVRPARLRSRPIVSPRSSA